MFIDSGKNFSDEQVELTFLKGHWLSLKNSKKLTINEINFAYTKFEEFMRKPKT